MERIIYDLYEYCESNDDLLCNLEQFDISGNLLAWFKSDLSDR